MAAAAAGGGGTAADGNGASPAAGPQKPGGATFVHRCQMCDAQLRLVDDLSPRRDVSQSFRGAINESFVVVPHSEADECVETPLLAGRGAGMNESFVVVPDHRGEADRGANSPKRGEGTTPSSAPAPGAAWELPLPPPEQVSRVEHVIKLASGQTEQDHPVCGDCLKAVVAEVQRLVDAAQADHRAYAEAHAQLQDELRSHDAEESSQLEAEIADMEAEEQALLGRLRRCDDEERQLQEELEHQGQQEEALLREEDELWLSYAEYQLGLEEEEEERAATASAIRYASGELHRLQRTHVLNDMFHITDQGQFGTINKFRMGQPVPCEELNAAWGQACLLLDALIKRCGVSTGKFRLVPRGSFSAIQVGEEVFQLWTRDSGYITGFWAQKNFDTAMVNFLKCLELLVKWLQRDPTVGRLPYKIEQDKVGGLSVTSLFRQPEQWTKALKFMLADLKWTIVYVEYKSHNSNTI